ncbi:MAG: molybdopterin-dependent oxidoreductase [Pseudomonadota bacterium]
MPENRPLLTAAHWGTYEVKTENGRVTALLPFSEDPNPSPIGQGIVDVMDGPTRITQPMIRKSWLKSGPGARAELRGQDAFVAVDWPTAERLVADELERVRTRFGNGAIYGGSYGWASAGRFHHAQSQVHRFLNCVGGYVRSLNTYSYAAAEVAVPHILGDFRSYVNSATSWSSIIGTTDLFVAFGGIPTKNGQIDNGGVGQHGQESAVAEAAASGVQFVNINPSRAAIPASANAAWLAPRPTTDTAILLAMAYELLIADLHDRSFLARYCVGFEPVEAYLRGQSDGIAKTADWAAEISGLPAEDIRSLAHRMAAGRTMISVSWSLTRQQYGEQPYWAALTLAAMLGQIGRPGGGIGFGYSATNGIGAQYQRLRYASLPQGENRVQDFIPVARIADMLLHPGAPYDYNGERRTYPDIRLVYWAGGNPFHHHQDLARLVKAWQRPETIITHEWCWTATAQHSDIVLPCTNHLERTDLALSPRDPYLVHMDQAVEPVGAARDDYDIFAGIAGQMGLKEAFTEGRSKADWLRWIYDRSRANLAAQGLDIPAFESFKARGWHRIDMPDRPTILMEAFIADPAAAPLKTPSGRIELYSETVAGFGYPSCPGHAAWHASEEWLGRAEIGDRLHLICVQPANKLHSQLDHGGFSQGQKPDGREPVRLSPVDAQPRGIGTGDLVRLHNARGSCLATAVVTDDLRPGVVEMSTGAWFDPARDATGAVICKAGNPNTLTPDIGTSSLAQGPSAHSCLIRLDRVDPADGTGTG